ncbi:MAG: hypothetical protein ABI862_18430 [Ilumatobacteraceae bacterium]
MTVTDTQSPPAAARPDTTAGGRTIQSNPDFAVQSEAQVDAAFLLLEERRAAANRAATYRRNAAIARQVAQGFSEYARAFRKAAGTRGSDVDHAVAVSLAEHCEAQAAEYSRQQTDFTGAADRIGSL